MNLRSAKPEERGNLEPSTNFVTQSWNSLEAVSRVEDYKVFLNPEKIAEFSDATKLTSAKTKVINAWKDGGLLGNEAIQGKFKSYFNYDNYFDEIQFEQMLKDNDNWFKKIFIENLD